MREVALVAGVPQVGQAYWRPGCVVNVGTALQALAGVVLPSADLAFVGEARHPGLSAYLRRLAEGLKAEGRPRPARVDDVCDPAAIVVVGGEPGDRADFEGLRVRLPGVPVFSVASTAGTALLLHDEAGKELQPDPVVRRRLLVELSYDLLFEDLLRPLL